MVRVLVRRKYLAPSRPRMIVVTRFDETVLRKRVAIAISNKLLVAAKNLWLVLQEIHNFHRRALLVVVINLRRVARLYHALVNARNGVLNVEEIHIHIAERSSIVRKRAVANRWPRNRGKPAVENRIFRGEPCQHGELVRWEIGHNGPRSVDAGALRGIALDEALHVRGPACARR